ncbi:16304_t:CDS:2 [Cetraspora pellucida]|uniref:Protein dpy-30 homolog n=1 Tax=Cetraspora pellucida TaxID=1433469 RepID=A0A9N9DWI7_9GLOM|nr:16304_t:CDS:2 [Cetraspora pellucida]
MYAPSADDSMYTDSSPAETSNNEYENGQHGIGAFNIFDYYLNLFHYTKDILNADSQSPIKREEPEVDVTGEEPSATEDQPSPLKFDDQFGEVVDEERDKIQRLNMRHPHNNTAVRDYLNKTVVPSLMAGLKKIVRERPTDPCEFLGRYLIDHCQHDHTKDEYGSEMRIKHEDTDDYERTTTTRQKQRRDSNSSLDVGSEMDVDVILNP